MLLVGDTITHIMWRHAVSSQRRLCKVDPKFPFGDEGYEITNEISISERNWNRRENFRFSRHPLATTQARQSIKRRLAYNLRYDISPTR